MKSMPFESATRLPFHQSQACTTVTTQLTARMQMPMNIQLPKLNFHSRSALIAANGRFRRRARWETTRSVPTTIAPVAAKKR